MVEILNVEENTDFSSEVTGFKKNIEKERKIKIQKFIKEVKDISTPEAKANSDKLIKAFVILLRDILLIKATRKAEDNTPILELKERYEAANKKEAAAMDQNDKAIMILAGFGETDILSDDIWRTLEEKKYILTMNDDPNQQVSEDMRKKILSLFEIKS